MGIVTASGSDAYAPSEIASRVETSGVQKANLAPGSMFVLAFLAGSFIALGAAFSTVVAVDPRLGYGVGRLLTGLSFSLGLILVVVAGAELFTGNNLIVMAWASRKVPTKRLLYCWTTVYLGNFAGAVATACLLHCTGFWKVADGGPALVTVRLALAKASLGFVQAFASGIVCNVLVCLAVWLVFAARSVTDKLLAVVFPITAFVAMGFEHCVANMYFLPAAWMMSADPAVLAAGGWTAADLSPLSLAGFIRNLVPVTLGNIVGGGLLVAGVYWSVYLRKGSCVNGDPCKTS